MKRKTAIHEIGESMEKDFEQLMQYVHQDWKNLQVGAPFSIYHRWDLVGQKVVYTAALPMIQLPKELSAAYETGILPAMSAYSIVHKGPYRHIANAWSAGMMHQRAKKFKPLGKRPPMEIYWNNPKETAAADLKTEIVFPAKN